MDDITAVISVPSNDADDDFISYNCEWMMAESTVFMFEEMVLPSSYTNAGEIWVLKVTPFDGTDLGESSLLPFEIEYPFFYEGIVDPLTGRSGDVFFYAARFASIREIPVAEAWVTVDGEHIYDLAEETDTLGNVIWWAELPVIGRGMHNFVFGGVDANGNDILDIAGVQEGPELENGAPWIEIAFISAIPEGEFSRNGVLVANVEARDYDLDELTIEYRWFVNDEPVFGATEWTLGNEHFNRGDMVHFEARVSDGLETSDGFLSEPVLIGNAAPVVTLFGIDPENPFTINDLESFIDAEDLDGDRVSVSYRWFKDESTAPFEFTGSTLPSRFTKKH
jgi:hypothetical protein